MGEDSTIEFLVTDSVDIVIGWRFSDHTSYYFQTESILLSWAQCIWEYGM